MPITCSKCQTSNRDGARFCSSCAAPLVTSVTCPACGAENQVQARYCHACATQLRGASPAAGLGTGMLQANTLLQERYIVVRRVGQGGMGAVYEAADKRISGKRWALKEMSDAALSSTQHRLEAVTAFRQEAQMLAKLSHPNLPAVSDYFSEGGKQYLVMEFVDGDTLEDRLARTSGFLDEAQVVDWATQICDVLSYLHSQQPPVIFRDLKPSNIMVDRSGRVKLIDFGIARLFKPGKSGDTQVMGTPGYAAPEQYGKAQTDPRSDVYSLGVTLHRLLTKYDPADTPFNLPQTRSLNPKVSSGMAALIERATRTDATARYQSAREMQQALKAPPAPAPAKPQPAPAQVAVAPVATPVAPAAAAPPIATPAPARQAAAPASLSRSGLWGTLLISLFLGGVAGFASQALPSDLGVSIPSVGRLSLAAAILFAAAPLAAKLTRRPGAALLTAAAAGLLPLLLRGGLSGDLPALLQLVVPMGLATELIFLLGGYRHFGLVAMVLAALAGVAGEAVSLLLVYEFSPSLDFLLPLAVAAVVGGAVAWLIGRVFGR